MASETSATQIVCSRWKRTPDCLHDHSFRDITSLFQCLGPPLLQKSQIKVFYQVLYNLWERADALITYFENLYSSEQPFSFSVRVRIDSMFLSDGSTHCTYLFILSSGQDANFNSWIQHNLILTRNVGLRLKRTRSCKEKEKKGCQRVWDTVDVRITLSKV